jgi:regulator of protease activity HflC (stomatin/prohibitin superfamily)
MTTFPGRSYGQPNNLASAGIKVIGAAVVLFAVVVLFFMSATTIGAGQVGVLTLFGRVTGERLDSGLHFVNPLKSVHKMVVRTQSLKESAAVPSSEGLVINLDTSVVFHVNPGRAPDIYRDLGPNYVEVIVEPTVRSAVREATSSHTANSLYSSGREEVARQILATLTTQLGKRGIEVEQVLLRDIQLPATLKQSIEAKQQAEQESLAMSFRLQKERQEAERKRIEAQGIRDFQQTVSQGISAQLLEWKGIEATETLAKSPNSKIVVIGGGKNGLPLILGQ